MAIETKRDILLNLLRNIPTEMRQQLEEMKRGSTDLNRPDFIWHFLLQSFATMGSSRGWKGLIADKANYDRVTFAALSQLNDGRRVQELEDVLRVAKVRMPKRKAEWLALNYKLIEEMGGLEVTKTLALA